MRSRVHTSFAPCILSLLSAVRVLFGNARIVLSPPCFKLLHGLPRPSRWNELQTPICLGLRPPLHAGPAPPHHLDFSQKQQLTVASLSHCLPHLGLCRSFSLQPESLSAPLYLVNSYFSCSSLLPPDTGSCAALCFLIPGARASNPVQTARPWLPSAGWSRSLRPGPDWLVPNA